MLNRKHFLFVISLFLVLVPLSAVVAQPAPGWLATETARDYRTQARYPGHSWALEAGALDPVRDKHTPSRQSARSQGGEATLTVWSAAVSFEPNRAVDLFASLDLDSGAVDQIQGEVVSASGEIVATVSYADQGQGVDRRRGDGVFSARIEGLPVPVLAESYMVRVEAALVGGEVIHAVGGFLLSNPGAHLTGRFRDSVRDGSLLIRSQVEVERRGRFHLQATLHDRNGTPLGVAQTALQLEPGRQWVELEFFGLMFHDRGVAGPYRLASVALADASGMPNALATFTPTGYTTRAYPLRRFRQDSFNHSGLLAAAQRLEAEASRSRAATRE